MTILQSLWTFYFRIAHNKKMTNISFIEDIASIFSVVNSTGKTQVRESHDISLDYFLVLATCASLKFLRQHSSESYLALHILE